MKNVHHDSFAILHSVQQHGLEYQFFIFFTFGNKSISYPYHKATRIIHYIITYHAMVNEFSGSGFPNVIISFGKSINPFK